MSKNKNIAVFTSIRSEYGLLKPFLDLLKKDKELNLLLLVGGAHLLNEHGHTKDEIVKDGFDIAAEFDFLQPGNDPGYLTHSMGILQIQVGKWLTENQPGMLVVLGDRFELLPVVSSALILNVPVAHISGGDVTEGAIDNQVRNAITKMAHLHFPATEIYRENILKMGEEDWRICVSGEPGLDQVLTLNYYSKETLFDELGLDKDNPVICATFHPETIGNSITPAFIEQLLNAITSKTPYQVIITAANFDAGGDKINQSLEKISSENPKVKFIKSLGQRRYYSLMKYADLMIGNSSSGLVEAQSFNLPVINVGSRQLGRLFNKNVIHVDANEDEIINKIQEAASENFKKTFRDASNIYGKGKASEAILDFIKRNIDHPDLLIKKSTF